MQSGHNNITIIYIKSMADVLESVSLLSHRILCCLTSLECFLFPHFPSCDHPIICVFLFSAETLNQASPSVKLEEVIHLAELCIEVLQQNEEHHSEVRITALAVL